LVNKFIEHPFVISTYRPFMGKLKCHYETTLGPDLRRVFFRKFEPLGESGYSGSHHRWFQQRRSTRVT